MKFVILLSGIRILVGAKGGFFSIIVGSVSLRCLDVVVVVDDAVARARDSCLILVFLSSAS
jgi:hypothetical protein